MKETSSSSPSHAQINEVDLEVFLGDDPALALARADPKAWSDAHPCECEALCECKN